MLRTLIALLLVLLVAGCGRTDISDPAKPHPRLLASGAAQRPASKPGDAATDAAGASSADSTAAASAHEPAQPPEDFVREFFRTYLDSFEDKSWFGDEEQMAPWFAEGVVQLALANHAACRKDEEQCLDFDPIIDGQDYDDDIFSTLHTERMGTGAPVRVKVTFENLGSTMTMTYTLVQVDAGWRISDIQSSNYGALTQVLSSGSGSPPV